MRNCGNAEVGIVNWEVANGVVETQEGLLTNSAISHFRNPQFPYALTSFLLAAYNAHIPTATDSGGNAMLIKDVIRWRHFGPD